MSKFIDRLKQVSQPPPPPIGFRAASAAARPKIQLVAQGAVPADKLAMADAVIFPDAKSGVEEKPWGVRFKTRDKADTLIKAGADFVILPADSAVISVDKKIGKILELTSQITDVLLRTVNDLPVDAVLLDENGTDLTWHKLMLFQRFAGLTNKPVLVAVAPDISAEDLQLVWETGVSGVIVKIGADSDADILTSLHDKIDGLQFPSRRKKEKVHPTLPQLSPRAEKQNEEEDDDGEEDDE